MGFCFRVFAGSGRRQCQFLGQGNAGPRQLFDNRVTDKLRAIPIARLGKSGIQLLQEFFIHRNRQQLLAFGALIWHALSIHLFHRPKKQKYLLTGL